MGCRNHDNFLDNDTLNNLECSEVAADDIPLEASGGKASLAADEADEPEDGVLDRLVDDPAEDEGDL